MASFSLKIIIVVISCSTVVTSSHLAALAEGSSLIPSQAIDRYSSAIPLENCYAPFLFSCITLCALFVVKQRAAEQERIRKFIVKEKNHANHYLKLLLRRRFKTMYGSAPPRNWSIKSIAADIYNTHRASLVQKCKEIYTIYPPLDASDQELEDHLSSWELYRHFHPPALESNSEPAEKERVYPVIDLSESSTTAPHHHYPWLYGLYSSESALFIHKRALPPKPPTELSFTCSKIFLKQTEQEERFRSTPLARPQNSKTVLKRIIFAPYFEHVYSCERGRLSG